MLSTIELSFFSNCSGNTTTLVTDVAGSAVLLQTDNGDFEPNFVFARGFATNSSLPNFLQKPKVSFSGSTVQNISQNVTDMTYGWIQTDNRSTLVQRTSVGSDNSSAAAHGAFDVNVSALLDLLTVPTKTTEYVDGLTKRRLDGLDKATRVVDE